jgi:tRNA(adenine34) deaminase
MSRALDLARLAAVNDEVPVGAVLVDQHNQMLGEGWNRPVAMHDPTAHAEILALRAAAARMANYRLPGTTLYVTLEPCAMCAGAMVHARIERVVIATADPRTGAAGSVFNLLQSTELNHRVAVKMGMLQQESADLLQDFFRQRR